MLYSKNFDSVPHIQVWYLDPGYHGDDHIPTFENSHQNLLEQTALLVEILIQQILLHWWWHYKVTGLSCYRHIPVHIGFCMLTSKLSSLGTPSVSNRTPYSFADLHACARISISHSIQLYSTITERYICTVKTVYV